MGCQTLKFQKVNLSKTLSIQKVAIATFWIFSSGFINCNHTNYHPKDLVHLRLIVNYPLVQANSNKAELQNLKDTVHIYYYNTDVLYYIPYKKTVETEEKLISEEKKYSYFIYTKDSSSGFFFSSSEDTVSPKKLSVDSFLFRRAYAAKFDLQNKRIISVNEDKFKGVVIEKYVPENIPNETTYDTVMFYFDNRMNDVSFSFSDTIDKAKGKKLFKIRLLYNEKFSQQYQMMMPQRELYFEIQKLPVKNSKSIVHFFDHLKTKIKTYVPHS